jgi:type VI secretion system secreted protein Hcp
MPVPAYATIQGQSQGQITKGANTSDSVGNSYQEAHQDESLVQAFTTNVTIPRDPQSGQPTGLRVHQPASITKSYDKASPMLWQALCTGEILQISLSFWRTSLTGQQEQYFTIKYTDALLVDGQGYVPDCLDEQYRNYPHMETWKFTYRKVDWTHEKAGTSGSDDWRSPNDA